MPDIEQTLIGKQGGLWQDRRNCIITGIHDHLSLEEQGLSRMMTAARAATVPGSGGGWALLCTWTGCRRRTAAGTEGGKELLELL
jgi:hypothetical protein